MIKTQTFAFKDCKDELMAIATALDMIGKKQYDEACKVLIRRHDELTKAPVLMDYDHRAA
jgi:hypothetical protein